MKKIIVIFAVVLLGLSYGLITKNSVTKQAINYEVTDYPIPLYLKTLQFFTRHYSYSWLLERIIAENDSEIEKVCKIVVWANEHIQPQPEELPVIDDHVWDIIVRGYGKKDQLADVVATLCNYEGIPSVMFDLYEDRSREGSPYVTLVAFRIGSNWHFCDPERAVLFYKKSDNGALELAAHTDLASKNVFPVFADNRVEKNGIDKISSEYSSYLNDFKVDADYDAMHRFHRSSIQTPLGRLKAYILK